MYGIFTYIWLIFMVNVGIYTSPMDPMGHHSAWDPCLCRDFVCQEVSVNVQHILNKLGFKTRDVDLEQFTHIYFIRI